MREAEAALKPSISSQDRQRDLCVLCPGHCQRTGRYRSAAAASLGTVPRVRPAPALTPPGRARSRALAWAANLFCPVCSHLPGQGVSVIRVLRRRCADRSTVPGTSGGRSLWTRTGSCRCGCRHRGMQRRMPTHVSAWTQVSTHVVCVSARGLSTERSQRRPSPRGWWVLGSSSAQPRAEPCV